MSRRDESGGDGKRRQTAEEQKQRRDRLARALRENLQRRKAQARARADHPPTPERDRCE